MHRTSFGEPRPASYDEIEEALESLDFIVGDGGGAHVRINSPDPVNDGTVFQGWTAEAIDDAGVEFETAGYASIENLVADLKAAGFETFEGLPHGFSV